jgi:hypothetical protein
MRRDACSGKTCIPLHLHERRIADLLEWELKALKSPRTSIREEGNLRVRSSLAAPHHDALVLMS